MDRQPLNHRQPLGLFYPLLSSGSAVGAALLEALRRLDSPLFLTAAASGVELRSGFVSPQATAGDAELLPFVGMIPACPLESLGDPGFCRDHGLRYPYIGGSMAKGISSVAMVRALGDAGMLGFFGAAGLPLEEVEDALAELQSGPEAIPFGVNLIHSPNEPQLEEALVDLYLRRGIALIEASAFLDLTLPVVRFRTHGIYRDPSGEIVTPNRVIAKISREEVAAKFFAPPPERFLQALVAAGDLSKEQAELAASIPMAQDVTVEADSGGHTDNRPAISLFPSIRALRQEFQDRHGYRQRLRIGLGGGISTPASAAAAFVMGAAYLVTGSVNQACVESGTCDEVRQLLAETRQADITMAPSGDMFEMGVNVQVLKRGTMFSMRAARLYELYRLHGSIDELPALERQKLEKTVFRLPLETVWDQTRTFFSRRDPRQLEKAERDPKYRMALVFRWYLGQSPVWANRGESSRRIDYQIWCGPAMGAFNEWARGSFLEEPSRRQVVTVALNLLFGAAVIFRANQLSLQGMELPSDSELLAPLETARIKEYLS
ncbi:PfaD family protein [Desulfuromonas soudanensis]|uniref:PfaD family protein n=2 Tax=Desulfuromonas soudanensis TaxID=1603606 RepID=A0A0M4D2C4_9BACT|nr:PfaD family polyunsaturated fatty acid/polyketide biosynthesis protein [Desulfuromonas soudanensis]ALC17402.1 PfaD family protein [Desulfuromonas soudanensis]